MLKLKVMEMCLKSKASEKESIDFQARGKQTDLVSKAKSIRTITCIGNRNFHDYNK